jgi:hypothetical protein
MLGCGDASADDEDKEDGDDGEWIGVVVGHCRTGSWRYGWAGVATCGIVAARVAARGQAAARVAARGQAAARVAARCGRGAGAVWSTWIVVFCTRLIIVI